MVKTHFQTFNKAKTFNEAHTFNKVSGEAGYSVLELIVVLCVISILYAISLPSLLSKWIPSPRQYSKQIVAFLDRASLLAQWSGLDYEVRMDGSVLRILQAKKNTQTDLIHFEIPKQIHLEMRFGTISHTPKSLFLWQSGQATPGTIKISSEHAKSCLIHQAIYGARRIECVD